MKAPPMINLSASRFACLSALIVGAGLSACGASNDITVAPTSSAAAHQVTDAPAPLENGRLPDLAQPIHYTLDLEIDPKSDHLEGAATLAIEIKSPTDVLILHARDLAYTESYAVDNGEKLPLSITPRASRKNLPSPDEIVVGFPRTVSGKIELHFTYKAPFTDQLSGAYKTDAGGDSYVFTQFEPMDARRAMPCFDEPGFKVPFSLSITTPSENVAVANTIEKSREEVPSTGPAAGKKMTKFTFAETKPLPTYLVAFAVGPFDIVAAKNTRVPLRVVTIKGKGGMTQAALDATRAFIDFDEKYFEVPYPYDKLDLVAVPDFAAGAMENAGLITFREELILADPKHISTGGLRNIGLVISHELSHHWFGDLVTMAWWDDLWLNEGFATWMETKTVDAWRPEFGAGLSQVSTRSEAMQIDARPSAQAIHRNVKSASDAEEAFDPIIYDKGAAVLGMLESWLGETAFQAGVRQYLKVHAYGSATAGDLFQALAAASKKDVVKVANSFYDSPGVPLMSAELDCKDAKAPKVKVKESRLIVSAKGAQESDGKTGSVNGGSAGSGSGWTVPVCLDFDGRTGEPVCALIDSSGGTIDLSPGMKTPKCPRWVAPNAGEHGYYRYALSPDMFRSLAKANTDPRTKFGVLDNAVALVQSGILAADVLLDMVVAMKPAHLGAKLTIDESVVVERLIETLKDVSSTLVDDHQRPAFTKFAASILLPLAKDIGWEKKPGESDDVGLVRKDLLLGVAQLVDDPWVTTEAEKKVDAMMKDPNSVDSDIASAALVAVARKGNAARFEQMLALLKTTDSPQLRNSLLVGLGSFSDPALATRALDLMLTNDVKKQDGRYILRAFAWFPSSSPILLGWLANHWDDIKKKLPTFMQAAIPDEMSLCDETSLAQSKKLFDGKMKDVEGGERSASQLFERAELCMSVRDREKSRISTRLQVKEVK